jgi:hypothetical protein
MSRKPFYLSRHGKIWYARIIDQQTGKQLSAISTGQTNRDLAIMTMTKWLSEGLPKTKAKPKRPVSEAMSMNRLFDIVSSIDITN